MLSLRGLAPKLSFWRDAQFDTLRIGLLKVALPSSYPYQDSWLLLAQRAAARPP